MPTVATPDLTGDFCTSLEDRVEYRKEPEDAKEDVHTADRGQAPTDRITLMQRVMPDNAEYAQSTDLAVSRATSLIWGSCGTTGLSAIPRGVPGPIAVKVGTRWGLSLFLSLLPHVA